MSTSKFAEVHNMVAFLSKPTESEGFEQIIDFLNARSIKYALTINPTIYTSCIKQFLATAKVKNINGEAQLYAKVDEKKVVISKASIKRDLQFRDDGGVDCLPNEVIFEQLTLMGYEKLTQKLTFYKHYSTVVICLATNQKFNFSKYIFNNMVKNLDSVTKLFMYPSKMKRVGKDFFRRVTPLLPMMMVQDQEEMGEGTYILTDPQHTPTITQQFTSQPSRKQNPWKTKRKDTQVPQLSMPTESVTNAVVNEEMDDRLVRAITTASSLEAEQDSGNIVRPNPRQHLMSQVPKGLIQVIDSLKRRVKKLEKKKRSRTHKLKRLYKIGLSTIVESLDDEDLGKEDASKQRRIIDDLDADEDITLVNDQEMFDADKDLQGEELVVEKEVVVDKEPIVDAAQVSAAATTITIDDITLAKAPEALKTLKPKIR
uniref:Uncharacterized protein n=1 Tax=Tanacetum cinerariifolium TaxID=118510 RepID=A0A6L2NXD7_TANCI|nr:hypothetical protein [Tanacetum cinerariifolium]